jgi:hypothetical protein
MNPVFSYKDIPNHFSFQDVYDRAVAESPDPAVFVEVGTWFGSSTVYLASKIRDSGKRIKLYAVDNFTAEGAGPVLTAISARCGGNFYRIFRKNLLKCGVAQFVEPVIGDSTATAARFADESLDFVYIDACHEYRKVKSDIRAWRAKVRSGGLLAGHDFDLAHLGVVKAVQESLGASCITVMRHSWLYRCPLRDNSAQRSSERI